MNSRESVIKEYLGGMGSIHQDGKTLFSGRYFLRKVSGRNIATEYLGKFTVSQIRNKAILYTVCKDPLPELNLVLRDGQALKINLINGDYLFSNGYASYDILVLP